ncbi:MAG TPA: SDR family oxidoreductase [Longimicrobium sp.]|nr:SDR family oxidoreductase [Longimicrobium sp.]
MENLSGRVCVVTGANGGIGKATAAALARRGATVAMVCRRPDAGTEARDEVARDSGGDVHLLLADLASQTRVRHLAAEIGARWGRVDVLVNNAGVYTRRRATTADGIETQWAVNHLAPFLLTHLLRDALAAGGGARVVTVSSEAHQGARLDWGDLQMERRYRPFRMYAWTKLANVLFTRELARRLAGTGVTANAMHPGVVATELLMNGFPPIRLVRRFLRTPEQGARTAVWLAAAPEAAGLTGGYFRDERPARPSAAALDDDDARRLWRWSEERTGIA